MPKNAQQGGNARAEDNAEQVLPEPEPAVNNRMMDFFPVFFENRLANFVLNGTVIATSGYLFCRFINKLCLNLLLLYRQLND